MAKIPTVLTQYVPDVRHVIDGEFVRIETQRSVTDRATTVAVVLHPPRPSSSFSLSDNVVEDSTTETMLAMAHSSIAKHAAELRWNCIETMLRADIDAKRLDVKRMQDWLVANLDDQQREWLAVRLMEGVKAVPR